MAEHALGDLAQRRVAAGMAEAVVDVLEAVDVEQEEREGSVVGAALLVLEIGLEVAAVEDAGEAVGDGEIEALRSIRAPIPLRERCCSNSALSPSGFVEKRTTSPGVLSRMA